MRKIYSGFHFFAFFLILGAIILVLLSRAKSTTLKATDTGFYLYISEEMGLSIQYPAEWSTKEIDYETNDLGFLWLISDDILSEYTEQGYLQMQGVTLGISKTRENTDQVLAAFVSEGVMYIDGNESYTQTSSGASLGRHPANEEFNLIFKNGEDLYQASCKYNKSHRDNAVTRCKNILNSITLLSHEN